MPVINEPKMGLGTYGVSTQGVTVAGTTKVYNTIAQRDADRNSGMFAFVRDASADNTVKSGFAIYYKKASGWKKIFEEEAMDRDISELVTLQWSRIVEGPNSTPSQIDESVALAHEHANKEVLDKIDFTDQYLMYDGSVVRTMPAKYTKWLQLVRPIVTSENVHCTITFYSDPALTQLIMSIDSVSNKNLFKYFDGEKFVTVTTSIPDVTSGRFVIVDVESFISNSPIFIQWKWTLAGEDDSDTGTIISSGLCVYPSITPTNTESVGLVWSNN